LKFNIPKCKAKPDPYTWVLHFLHFLFVPTVGQSEVTSFGVRCLTHSTWMFKQTPLSTSQSLGTPRKTGALRVREFQDGQSWSYVGMDAFGGGSIPLKGRINICQNQKHN